MHKILSRILLTLVISTVLLLSLLPELARWQAIRALSAQGIDLEIDYLGLALRKGEISIDGLRIKDQDNLDISLATLNLQLRLLPLLDNQIEISHLSLHDLIVKLESAQEIGLGSVELKGEISVLLPDTIEDQANNSLSLKILESLKFNKFSFTRELQSIVQLDEGEVHKLRIELSTGTGSNKSFELSLQNVQLRDTRIFGMEHLDYSPAEDFSEHVSIAELHLNKMAFKEIGDDGKTPRELSIQSLELGGLNTLLLKVPLVKTTEQSNSKGPFPLIDIIKTLQAPEESSVHQPAIAAPQTPLLFSLEQLNISDNSRFTLIDTSHTPATSRSVEEILLEINNIDQANPSGASAFSLKAKSGDYSELSFKGDIKPFSESVNLAITGQVKSFDLSPLSAYAENSAAHRIKSGHLNAELEGSIIDNNIDVQVLLDLRKFYLENLEKNELPSEAEGSSMPIASALNLLRDNDDRIEFKLPISGDVSAPDFSIQYILGILARKAITETVINYYTPFGLLGLTSALVNSATQLRLEPVSFEAGRNTLTSAGEKNIDRLADLLSKKQSLTLTLCPVSTGGDWRKRFKQREDAEVSVTQKQGEELETLGLERGSILKNSLVKRNVPAEQIVVCKATIKQSVNSSGYVNIEL